MATHNQFAYECGKIIFNRTAPVIKLNPGANRIDYIDLNGALNSSIACFWMKQVFHCKGGQGINEGAKAEQWEQFYEFDATKIKAFPIPEGQEQAKYAEKLHTLAQARLADSIPAILATPDWQTAADLRALLDARRERDTERLGEMIGLQEELDWLCYRLYGLDDTLEILPVDDVPALEPGARLFEITLARADAERRAALERGETPSESPTAWFERHRATPRTDIPDHLPADYRALVEKRLERTRESKNLALVEQPTYKRRWYHPDNAKEEHDAIREWLADRLEDLARTDGRLRTPSQLATLLESDERHRAAASVLAGRTVHDLEKLVHDLLVASSVPSHPLHRYSKTGLTKRAAWEQTWDLQRREDAGEDVTPPVPPKYTQKDFRKASYYRLRGKLDVPKERFTAYTEIPGTDSGATLYGWAGWTPWERVKKLLEHDAKLERAGHPVKDRLALLDTAWRLLPALEPDHPADAKDFRAEIQALVGEDGPSEEGLREWGERFGVKGRRG